MKTDNKPIFEFFDSVLTWTTVVPIKKKLKWTFENDRNDVNGLR